MTNDNCFDILECNEPVKQNGYETSGFWTKTSFKLGQQKKGFSKTNLEM